MNAGVDHSQGTPFASQTEFNTVEAAEFLGCSPGYLQNLRQLGDGPPYNRRWKRKGIYYLRPDLVEWRRGRRYLSTTEY
ncbi:MAG: DNA-binding protein [Sphingomonas sp.]|uniref:helix-turn-helix domain-containing protein n=1 Tax=Sphingomonas sp. TaxID=28214 RepID=UPI0011F7F4E1|nr:helix-turn-helix domain-containing protein [Sphingomonas sp.]THD34442.1 MAG: DNA-binding protein [Sphingomonas sp.]